MFGKAEDVFLEFSKIFSNFDWALHVSTLPILAAEAGTDRHNELCDMVSEVILLQVEVSGHHAAAYHRRYVKPSQRLPWAECQNVLRH